MAHNFCRRDKSAKLMGSVPFKRLVCTFLCQQQTQSDKSKRAFTDLSAVAVRASERVAAVCVGVSAEGVCD